MATDVPVRGILGSAIPADAAGGQVEWSVAGGKNLTLIGRAGDYASGAVITTFMGEASVRVNCP